MIHHTRALRRASEAASARDGIVARRPMLILGTAAILGLTLASGMVAAPAAGDERPDPLAAVAAIVIGEEPAHKRVDDAVIPLAEAEAAVAAADALNAEVAASGLDLGAQAALVDTRALEQKVEALDERTEMTGIVRTGLTARVTVETDDVVAATADLRARLTAAQEQKAAADAAQAAAEMAAADAAAALAAANTVDGAKATAQRMAASDYGWGADQFRCLEQLWDKESDWNYQAYNPSGATGIPQALPGDKMASAGSDWQSNASTQIAWGLGYIDSVYGSPCGAWSHSQSMNWY
ncbi:phospholipase [Microbacterium sp.]|uniref:aggregation-promoting factor C-terminal-like domain-containing protein n=1 Tax=Microbacterium sp. TaxID=51671 RepID=UPI0028124B13|nr:phospholipase [Microbacterium sp.]